MTSFPVPFSPVMSTFASAGPMRWTTFMIDFIAGDSAMIRGRLSGPPSSRSVRFSASSPLTSPQSLRQFCLCPQDGEQGARSPRASE
jgi:hypothetical protein